MEESLGLQQGEEERVECYQHQEALRGVGGVGGVGGGVAILVAAIGAEQTAIVN